MIRNEVIMFIVLIVAFVLSQIILEKNTWHPSLPIKLLVGFGSLLLTVYFSLAVFYNSYLFIAWVTFAASYCLKYTRLWMRKINS